jgi:hypothetical protein
MIYLAIVLSSLPLVLETQVGAFDDCMDGSKGWEIGTLFDSVFGSIACVFAVGYVICKGVEGYVIVGWVVWIWLICGV